MSKELKTLKEIGCLDEDYDEDCAICFFKRELKAEAIKWIKKDKEDILKEDSIITPIYLLKRFMRRLNITEEELEAEEK